MAVLSLSVPWVRRLTTPDLNDYALFVETFRSSRFKATPQMLCSGRPSTRSPTRVPDGVWNGPNGPQCTRLSAVLAAERLTPWSRGQRGARFIENPWATRPVEGLDFRIEAFRPRDGRLN